MTLSCLDSYVLCCVVSLSHGLEWNSLNCLLRKGKCSSQRMPSERAIDCPMEGEDRTSELWGREWERQRKNKMMRADVKTKVRNVWWWAMKMINTNGCKTGKTTVLDCLKPRSYHSNGNYDISHAVRSAFRGLKRGSEKQHLKAEHVLLSQIPPILFYLGGSVCS